MWFDLNLCVMILGHCCPPFEEKMGRQNKFRNEANGMLRECEDNTICPLFICSVQPQLQLQTCFGIWDIDIYR